MRRVEVNYQLNYSTATEFFTAERSSTTMAGRHSPHGTVIKLWNGRDEKGNLVLTAIYRDAERVITYEE